jgi:hypothetical protein
MKRARSPIASDLIPRHVLADLFDTDFPVPIPDPETAAEIVIQRLIDAGFEIKAQERAQPRSAGTDHTGSVTASGWRHTLAGCSDNNWRGLSSPCCLL